MIDIHSHILPGVDDGAKNIAESIRLLKDLKMQGVECVYATPHFYMGKMPFPKYIEQIDTAYAALTEAVAGKALPEIRRGYEVRAFRGMSTYEELKQMNLQDTHYLLVEIPYGTAVEDWVIHELYNMQFTLGLKPIIAHIERYFGYRGFDRLLELVVDGDVRTQITSSVVQAPYCTRKKIYTLIRDGLIHFIASDAHSMESRRGMFLKANEKLIKKCGEELLLKLYNRSRIMMHYGDSFNEKSE
ncbi:MAG: hypothetical protein IJW78_05990 [Clostridia bacterium]|nr:hypothetical protein [Clostridia bacterium]MBQ7289250.1 hypothetical protein [Clostridia bacterium]